MSKIENIKQLKLEIYRLEALSLQQEELIFKDFESLQKQFSFSNIIGGSISNLFENKESDNGFLINSLGFIINLVLRKTIFKNSTGIMGTILSSGLELLLNKLLSAKSNKIMDLVRGLFHKQKMEARDDESN